MFGASIVDNGSGGFEFQIDGDIKPNAFVFADRIELTNIDPDHVFKMTLGETAVFTLIARHGTTEKTVSITARGFEFGPDTLELRTRVSRTHFETPLENPVAMESSVYTDGSSG